MRGEKVKKRLLVVLGLFLLLVAGCGTKQEDADFFGEGEVYKFTYNDEALFYAVSIQEKEENYEERVISVVMPFFRENELFFNEYSSGEELESAIKDVPISKFVKQNSQIFQNFILTVEEEKVRLNNSTEEDKTDQSDFIIEKKGKEIQFYYEDEPNDKGEVIKTNKRELYQSLVERKEAISNLELDSPFEFDGGTINVKSEIKKEVFDNYAGKFHVVTIPIELTNESSSERTVGSLLPVVKAYNSNNQELQSLEKYAEDEVSTWVQMHDDMIPPGETVTTHAIIEEDPSAEYVLLITDLLIERRIPFSLK